jgi:hypothetical protein
MSDLAQLFQYAPSTAGYFVGQNQANTFRQGQLQNDELAQRIALEQAAEARKTELHPLNVQQQSLANQTTEAELPGKQANSQIKQNEATASNQTLNGSIAATNAKNQGAVTEEAVNQTKRASELMLNMGAQLEGVPAPLRGAVFRKMMEMQGMNPNAPHLAALLATDPTHMPEVAQSLAKRLGDQAMTMNPAARSSMYGHEVSKENENTRAATQVQVANIQTEGRIKAAEIRAKNLVNGVAAGKFSFEQAISNAYFNSMNATDPQEKAKWDAAIVDLQQMQLNKANATSNGKLGIDEKGNLTPRTVTPVVPKNPNAERVGILNQELTKAQQKIANPKQFMSPEELKSDPDASQAKARYQRDVEALNTEIKRLGGTPKPAGASDDDLIKKYLGK